MNFSDIAVQANEALFKVLETSWEQGLTTAQVGNRQKKVGFNELQVHEITWWHILMQQLKSPFLILLLGACVISYFLEDNANAIIIIAIVIGITTLGFYQEYGAYQTVKFLKKLIVGQTRVRRHGKELMIQSRDLVPGDIIIVEAGDIIPADIRFVQEYNLIIDESILTGESIAVHKIAQPLATAPEQPFQAANIGFSGTTIVSGKGWGVVFATGQNTIIGDITRLAAETPRAGVFEKEIGRFSKFILQLTVITLVCVIVANLLVKGSSANIAEILLFSLALAIGITPEALPVVTSFALARGAQRLARHKVVVKRLSAIDDLGSIQVLCVDKTGTLTENLLTISSINAKDSEEALLYACLSSSAWLSKEQPINNAIDSAFWARLAPESQKRISQYEKVFELPFDAERRRNTTVVKHGDTYELIVRGASEIVFESSIPNSYDAYRQWSNEQGRQGMRVIAVAHKQIEPLKDYGDIHLEENNLQLSGLISFIDPIKKTVPHALERAKELGVIIKIISGDAPEVVGAVAYQVGLASSNEAVITGNEFEKLSTAQKHKTVEEHAAFARFAPQQKYSLIKLLQEKYEVGFLGDGINDAPALKVANVALAVDGASDVARESADIILLKKSLRVIVNGIQEGRMVFVNTIKYVKLVLASNTGNFYAIALASLVIDHLPMLPLQILLLNLLSDVTMVTLATDNVDKEEVSKPTSFNLKDIALVATVLGLVSTVFDFIFFSLFYRLPAAQLQTNWFIASMLTQLVFVYSVRTRLPFYKSVAPSWQLIGATVSAALFSVILPFTWVGHRFFKFVSPESKHLVLIMTVVVIYFCVTESVKLIYYRVLSKKNMR
jgi:Mg2+-importing ATPase